MPHMKCLRRLLRSAGRQLLPFTHAPHSHYAATRTTPKLDAHLQTLHSCAGDGAVRSFRSSPSLRTGLPPPNHGSRCLGSLAPAAAFSSGCCSLQISAAHEGDHTYRDQVNLHQLVRSYSCSKLQYKLKLIPSSESLLKRTHSQGHLYGPHSQDSIGLLHDDRSAEWYNSTTKSPRSSPAAYARSWSAPSLRIRLHTKKTASGSGSSSGKGRRPRAPKGYVAVYVEGENERQVVPIPWLGHPLFQDLLRRAESEYGYAQKGGLLIPCSLAELNQTLHQIQSHPQLSH